MATGWEEEAFASDDEFDDDLLLSELLATKDVSTQCNFYLLDKPSFKDKKIMCNLTASRVATEAKAKPLNLKSVAIQCFLETLHTASSNALPLNKKSIPVNVKSVGKDVCTQTFTKYKPNLFAEIIRILEDYEELFYEDKEDYSGAPIMQISRRKSSGLFSQHLGFLEEPISLFLQVNGKCNLSILFKLPKMFCILNDGILDIPALTTALNVLSGRMGHIFCPGINSTNISDNNLTKTKNLLYIEYPFPRYQSTKCEVYYQLEDLTRILPGNSTIKRRQCQSCTYVAQVIAKNKKRKIMESPNRKLKRQRVTSNYPIKNLTPRSQKIRVSRIQQSRSVLKRKVLKLENQLHLRELSLNENQSKELAEIVQTITNDYSSELETSFNSTSGDTKDMLKAAWDRDSQEKHLSDQKEFFTEQEKLTRNSRVRKWNAITLRMCLAVCSRSKAAYEALRGFKILNLPSVSTLREKTRKLNHSPGINEEYLAEQQIKYKKFQDEMERKGDQIPRGIGVTIFDEVKVIDKVIWNSKTHEFMGLAMNEEDYPELTDIYKDKTLKAPAPIQYVLQYMWRDLTSGFDMIGPHFTTPYPFQQKSLSTTLYQTLEAFEMYGFKSLGIICDGASENLALIKLTMGVKGAFGYKIENDNLDFSIQPSFENPFSETPKLLHWVICPTHEMKNMIGQLYASNNKGPKAFKRNGINFGLEQVTEVYERDQERSKNNQMRGARFLLESYITRDTWSRLNVAPSKVMQQEDVLSELYGFAHGEEGTTLQRKSALETYKYLRACNKLFENGFLRAQPVKTTTSKVLNSIQEGYMFFEEWLRELLRDNPDLNLSNSRQEDFLSWQTWDLLRVIPYQKISWQETTYNKL